MEFGSTSAMDFGGIPTPSIISSRYQDCCATRVQRTVGERSHGVFDTLA